MTDQASDHKGESYSKDILRDHLRYLEIIAGLTQLEESDY